MHIFVGNLPNMSCSNSFYRFLGSENPVVILKKCSFDCIDINSFKIGTYIYCDCLYVFGLQIKEHKNISSVYLFKLSHKLIFHSIWSAFQGPFTS